jgi:hypothetical protein
LSSGANAKGPNGMRKGKGKLVELKQGRDDEEDYFGGDDDEFETALMDDACEIFFLCSRWLRMVAELLVGCSARFKPASRRR